MQLPFSKKRTSDIIDVKVDDKTPSPKHPAAISAILQPDLGDYGIERAEPLPSAGRIIPVVFWGSLVALAAGFVTLGSAHDANKASLRTAEVQKRKLTESCDSLNATSTELLGAARDLDDVAKWVELSTSVRSLLTSVTESASERVQIRNLEIKRTEPSIVRYKIIASCVGTKVSFEAMRKDLAARLDAANWSISESPYDPDDARLVLEMIVTSKKS